MHYDTTILIQGPLSDESISHIDDYKKVTPWIVVSCWEDDDYKDVERDAVVVTSCRDDVKPINVPGQDTFPFAVATTLAGLRFCAMKYVIKVRSDEYFTDLLPMIERLKRHDRKFVCGNVWLQRWRKKKYHIGDHVFAAKKETLYNAYEFIEQNMGTEPWVVSRKSNCAEQMVFRAFLKASGVDDEKIWKPDRDVLREYCDVVNVGDLGNFLVRNNHAKRVYRSAEGAKFTETLETLCS